MHHLHHSPCHPHVILPCVFFFRQSFPHRERYCDQFEATVDSIFNFICCRSRALPIKAYRIIDWQSTGKRGFGTRLEGAHMHTHRCTRALPLISWIHIRSPFRCSQIVFLIGSSLTRFYPNLTVSVLHAHIALPLIVPTDCRR